MQEGVDGSEKADKRGIHAGSKSLCSWNFDNRLDWIYNFFTYGNFCKIRFINKFFISFCMAKTRLTEYTLTCDIPEYNDLIDALKSMSVLHRKQNAWTEFLMPGAKVKVSLHDNKYSTPGKLERTSMMVKRTTLMEPRYVRTIIQEFSGKQVPI